MKAKTKANRLERMITSVSDLWLVLVMHVKGLKVMQLFFIPIWEQSKYFPEVL